MSEPGEFGPIVKALIDDLIEFAAAHALLSSEDETK
jgi:hypothetical protein